MMWQDVQLTFMLRSSSETMGTADANALRCSTWQRRHVSMAGWINMCSGNHHDKLGKSASGLSAKLAEIVLGLHGEH
jgi:hypothetical protein